MPQKYPGSRQFTAMLARAMALYTCLLRGDATRDELIEYVQTAVGANAYGAAPADALRRDLKLLGQLGFEVLAVRPGYTYKLVSMNPAFPLPLDAQQVETLAALRRAYANNLHRRLIDEVLRHIQNFLAPELRPLLDRPPTLRLEPLFLEDLSPYAEVLTVFEQARREHRRLTFLHRSNLVPEPTRYTLEPDGVEQRDGHTYLTGYAVETGMPLEFRLDRVVPQSAKLSPTRATSHSPRRPLLVRYRLTPAVARLGASQRFANHQEMPLPDGGVEVTAEARSVFWAAKTLLKYGENCLVLEPPELVAEMKRVVGAMAKNYQL